MNGLLAIHGNGCAERFIRTLKENLLWVRTFRTVEELGRCKAAKGAVILPLYGELPAAEQDRAELLRYQLDELVTLSLETGEVARVIAEFKRASSADAIRTDVATVLDACWGGPETLVVISTDLSHFHSYAQARNLDDATCQRILARERRLSGEQACGAGALNGLLTTELSQGFDIELIDQCNSGDTAGDREQVVGYAAFSLH